MMNKRLLIVTTVCLVCLTLYGQTGKPTLRLFSEDMKTAYPSVVYDFLERYLYDIHHTTSGYELRQRMADDKVSVTEGSLDNIYSTGYWNIHLPAMNRELEKRGVSNIFRDIKNKNVYMMDDVVSLSFVPYYSEHYHEMLEIDTLRTFGSMRMLKYHLAEGHDESEKD